MTERQTKDGPMTPEQERVLKRLCRKTGEKVERVLTRKQAQCRIDVLTHLKELPNG